MAKARTELDSQELAREVARLADSKLADEERGNQSKNYENQTKTEFAKFRTHTVKRGHS